MNIDSPKFASHFSPQCCIIGIDEETFDFFPVSFILYLTFLIILSLIIILKSNIKQHNLDSDYLLLYAMLIISIWDSLFSFYRYSTTAFCAKHFELLSMKKVLKYFSFY